MKLTAQYEFASGKQVADFLSQTGLLLYAWSASDVGQEWPLVRVWCSAGQRDAVDAEAMLCGGLRLDGWKEDEQKS